MAVELGVDHERTDGVSRRKVLGGIGAGAAAVWAAPTVLGVASGAASASGEPASTPARVVVNHDEWTFYGGVWGSPTYGPSAARFIQNLATQLAPPGGRILLYSSNPFWDVPQATAAVAGVGRTLVQDTSSSFGTLAPAYDAAFLTIPPYATSSEVAAFVAAGKGVYIEAGTGYAGDADLDPFLSSVGLYLDPGPYNGVGPQNGISSAHPVLAGVTDLFFENGNNVSTVAAPGWTSSIILAGPEGQGLIGVASPV